MINNNIKLKPFRVSLFSIKIRNYVNPVGKYTKYKERQKLPAIKEWPNSIYSFNKNNIINSPMKDLIADRLIKKFFYLVKRNKYISKSRRMRNFLIKSKTKRLYLSKPEIKQTSDKNTITVYNYDREKGSLVKKFFYYKRLIKTPVNKNISLTKKHRFFKERFLLKRLPLTGRKLRLEVKLYEQKLFNKISNFKTNKKKDFLFKYLFYKWILSSFGFKINILTARIKKKIKFLVITNNKFITKNHKHMFASLGFLHKNWKSISTLFKGDNLKNRDVAYKNNYILNLQDLTRKKKNVNMLLYSFLEKSLSLAGEDSSYKMNYFYRWYKRIYYKRFIKILLLKRIRLGRIRRFNRNNIKFNKYLPLLKLFLNKIYNKKIEINLINLKYPYLSSDIFVNSLATKLRNRKRKLVRVVKKYLKMIKIIKLSVNIKGNINVNKTRPHVISKSINAMANNVENLNNIKSKWITGIRLETAGRLTNRFVAQRSVYKYRQKGNLKSIDYRPVNFRTYISPNLQKSYVQSIRRIGAFGIKGWISSN